MKFFERFSYIRLKYTPRGIIAKRPIVLYGYMCQVMIHQHLATYVVYVATFSLKMYALMWFSIKFKPLQGAVNNCNTIQISRYLPKNLKDVVDSTIVRNCYYFASGKYRVWSAGFETSLFWHMPKSTSFSISNLAELERYQLHRLNWLEMYHHYLTPISDWNFRRRRCWKS